MNLKALVDTFHLKAQSAFDDTFVITGVNTLKDAQKGELSFFTNRKYRDDLMNTRASVVLLDAPVEGCPAIQLVAENTSATLARILQAMHPDRLPAPGIHATAVIADSAEIGPDCHIGPHCIIAEDAVIGKDCVLFGSCYVGKGSTLGDSCILYHSVTLYHNVHLGDRTRIHSGTVLGSDGFGFAQDEGHHIKIPQLGGVRLGQDVEVGSNCTIDRGALTDTSIGEGTKIDNQVQVAHGVRIGKHCLLAAQVGLSGSTTIGNGSVFAGRAACVGHIEIGDHVVLMAQSIATKSIKKAGYYAGFPAKPVEQYHRETASIRRIDSLRNKIKELEQCLKK